MKWQTSSGKKYRKGEFMTLEEENCYLTCTSDSTFYKTLCDKHDTDFTVADFTLWVKTCLTANGIRHYKILNIKVLKDIASYFVEELPLYYEKIRLSGIPECAKETKEYIKHKNCTEEFLKTSKELNKNIDKLLNKGKTPMKYANGFVTPTLYNNIDVNDLTREEIMQAIRDEKAKIKSLEDLKESKSIQKEIKKAEENVSKLLELLDKDFVDGKDEK